MSKVYICEYSRMVKLDNNYPPMADESSFITDQVVDFTAGVAPSATFDPRTNYLRITMDAICSVRIAVGAVATTNNKRFSAGDREYFALGDLAGKAARLSAIANT